MCDLDTIVGCVSNHWEFTRRHSDHFRPRTIHIDLFRCFMLFSMFACLYLTYRYLDGLSMPSPYYSIPIQCVSDLLRPFVDFIYLCSYRYSDVLIIYSYGRLRYYYSFGLRCLWTISHI